MKKFFHAALVLPLVLFAVSCSESDDGPKSVELTGGTESQQTVYADDEQAPAPIRFTAKAAWTATVAEVTTKAEGDSEVDWLDLSAYSGGAGNVSLTMTLSPNYTGADRKAEIRIECAGTSISITVEQKGTTEQGEVPKDPEKPDEKTPLDADGNILFPDAKFAAYMVKNFDTDRDGKISVKEAAAITRIDCSYVGIKSLAGIEYCTVLTALWCYDNQLTTLNVSKNTKLKLTELYCYDNQLTILDVSGCTALTRLDCSDNQLLTLDISECTTLARMVCCNNHLTMLDVNKNTKLTELDCANNQLTTLDVSKNTELTYLECGKNQLTTLNVSNNTKLTRLWCYGNQLTTLDVSMTNLGNDTDPIPLSCNMTTLQTLYLKRGWKLKGINDGARDEKYINLNTEIKYKN